MRKPFYKFPIAYVKIKRHKLNPMRFIFGDYFMVSNWHKRFCEGFDLDIKNIKINEKNRI